VIGSSRDRSSPETRALWSRANAPPGLDAVVAACALILGSGVFRDEFLYDWPYGTVVLHLLWSSIYAFVIVWLWLRFRHEWLLWSVRHLPLMCLVLAIALASTLWSLEPAVTLRRSLLLIASSAVGIFLGYNFAPRTLMRLLFWVFAGLLVVNALVSVAFPDYAMIDTRRVGETFATWQGVFSTKSGLGSVAAIASVIFLIGTLYGRIDRYAGVLLLALALVALVMSRAATSYVVGFTGLFVASSFAIARQLRFPALITFFYLVFGLVCAAWITTVALDDFTQLLDRDATLTKRTAIWSDAFKIIAERPWTGFGYEAAWGRAGDGAERFPYLSAANWAWHAHNGFLNLATQLGLPALALAAVHFLLVLVASVYAYLRHRSPSTLFGVTFVFMTLIANLAESSYFKHGSNSWILFVAVSTMAMRILAPAADRGAGARARRRTPTRPRQPRSAPARAMAVLKAPPRDVARSR
jgi:O-antigen ligase